MRCEEVCDTDITIIERWVLERGLGVGVVWDSRQEVVVFLPSQLSTLPRSTLPPLLPLLGLYEWWTRLWTESALVNIPFYIRRYPSYKIDDILPYPVEVNGQNQNESIFGVNQKFCS